MPLLVKLISNGVGLATEAMAHRRASKEAGSTPPLAGGPQETGEVIEISEKEAEHLKSTGQAVSAEEASKKNEPVNIIIPDRVEEDDEVWELDDAADEVWEELPAEEQPPAYAESEEAQKSSNKRIQAIVDNLGPAPSAQSGTTQLPYPVILPQRRPREKARGFVRAYAPSLSSAGIDEASFMSFLAAFHRESQVHPIFNVILVGTTIAGFVPDITVAAVCTAINVAVVPATIMQTRYSTNNFLDRANEAIFRPRGLYAMIVTFKSDTDRPISAQPLDINAAIMKYGQTSGSKTKDLGRKFRFTSGKTYGESELPEAAELVFPALDEAAEGQTKETQDVKDKVRRGSKFVQEYYDRRAQAVFLQENPDSTLLAKDPQFASSISDPTHPAYQGGLITLISGGRYQHRGLITRGIDLYNKRKAERTGETQTTKSTSPAPRPAANGRPVGRSRAASGSRARRPPPRRVGLIGSVKKALRQDVMYLMIVNMPSEEDMAKTQAELDKIQGQKEAGKTA
ncbi:hypothetical protein IWZ00DRAFT_42806 [Phyllosticta capitalensis]|uniref:uncharacterized protein n=1 Tax=Phyllosticta capitalensis TaxID=121624 RepID=UPI003130EE67